MMEHNLKAQWNYPTSIRVGAGQINDIADSCRDLNIKSPLIVTDSGLAHSTIVALLMQLCQAAALEVGIFTQVKSNPTEENVLDGVKAYRIGQHDGIIAFGGGSSLDAAKAIALMVGQTLPLWNFEDVGDNWKKVQVEGMAPLIAIPTTAGTGSEVGRAAVITDTTQGIKKIIFHPLMLPKRVLLDPELIVGLPAHLTAATGMDALSHCLEAFCAPTYHPMAEGIALEGMRLIKNNLLQTYQKGSDVETRTHMLVASAMGATAFQKGLGAMHALAHPLGALYDAHHGRLNALLMPYVLLANRQAIEDKINRLARFLSINNGFDGFMDWIYELRLELNIESNLSALGIDDQHFKLIAQRATEDASACTNPIVFTPKEYELILKDALG